MPGGLVAPGAQRGEISYSQRDAASLALRHYTPDIWLVGVGKIFGSRRFYASDLEVRVLLGAWLCSEPSPPYEQIAECMGAWPQPGSP